MGDPYGYAWNAEIVCADCVRRRLTATLTARDDVPQAVKDSLPGLHLEELSTLYAQYELGHTGYIGDLDTAVFPQPSWGSETLADSCGSCLRRIEDTL